MKRLMAKEHLDENEETELVEEIRKASFLVPATFIDGQFHLMTVEDHSGKKFIPIFTDRTEYDNSIDDITPLTNPFDIVLDLLDERVEGFAVNIAGNAFEMKREFLDKHFGGR